MTRIIQRRFIQWTYFDWLRMTQWEYGFTFTFKDDLHLRTAMRYARHYFANVDRGWFGQTLKDYKNDFKRMVFLERAPARRRYRNGRVKKDWKENSNLAVTAWMNETDSSNYLRPKLEREMFKIRASWNTKEFWHIHGVMILPKNLHYRQDSDQTGFRTEKNMIRYLERKWESLEDIGTSAFEHRQVGGSHRIRRIKDDDQRGRCVNYICQATKGDWTAQGIEDIYGVGDLLFIDVSNMS
jgi:hypothetical protein